MTKNLDEFKIEERIKISYLKHGGNILEVMQELNLPEEYVKKRIDKLRKKDSRDISSLISNNITSYILSGHESRKIHYLQILRELEQDSKVKLSVCCEAPAILLKDSNEYGYEDYECSLCHLRCEVKDMIKSDMYRIKKEVLEQLRIEDEQLMTFAEKMGYTNIESKPAIKVDQNVLIIGNNDGDKKIVEDLRNLAPKDRDRLLEKLNNNIIQPNEQENRNI